MRIDRYSGKIPILFCDPGISAIYRPVDARRTPPSASAQGRYENVLGMFRMDFHPRNAATGFEAFAAEILTEPVLPQDPAAGDIERHRLLSAMYAFFTGTSVQKNIQRPAVKPRKFERVIKKGGGC